MDSQILPNAVEYLLTPLRRLSSPDQFMPAAALAQENKNKSSLEKKEYESHIFYIFELKIKKNLMFVKPFNVLSEVLLTYSQKNEQPVLHFMQTLIEWM